MFCCILLKLFEVFHFITYLHGFGLVLHWGGDPWRYMGLEMFVIGHKTVRLLGKLLADMATARRATILRKHLN